MSDQADLRAAILAEFGEPATYVPAATPSATPTGFTARITRQPAPLEFGAKRTDEVWHAEAKVLATVDATYGGIVAPLQGDKWTFPLIKGGSPAVDWKVKSVQGDLGGWMVLLERKVPRGVEGRPMERA